MSDRKELRISTSLINAILPDGEPKPFCPRQLKMTRIDKIYRTPMTTAMAAGSYFEYICLGAGADLGDTVTDFTEIKSGRGGAKSVDQIRMEDQAVIFENLLEQFCGADLEVQRRIEKEWDHEYNEFADDYKIMVTGVVDFLAPVHAVGFDSNGERKEINYDEAIHDLKLTADIWGTFGRNKTWAYPWTMNSLQLIVYNYILGLPTFYWVFDYKVKPEFRIYEKEVTAIDKVEMHETIRKAAEILIEAEQNGWSPYPAYYRCKECPLSSEHCDQRTTIPDIQIY